MFRSWNSYEEVFYDPVAVKKLCSRHSNSCAQYMYYVCTLMASDNFVIFCCRDCIRISATKIHPETSSSSTLKGWFIAVKGHIFSTEHFFSFIPHFPIFWCWGTLWKKCVCFMKVWKILSLSPFLSFLSFLFVLFFNPRRFFI